MGPAILRHRRIVALGDRPGARRIHDARAFAGDQPAIVAGVVPGVNLGRIDLHDLAGHFHGLPRLVGIDLDVVLGIDEHDAIGIEQPADPVDRVGGLSHRQADREAGLVQLLRRLKIKLPGPFVGLGLVVFRLVRREHVLQIEAGMLLVEIQARAAGLDLTADRGRDAAPSAFDLGEIFGDRADRTVLLDKMQR